MKREICHVALQEEILGKSIRGRGVQEVVGLGPGRTQVWWDNFVNDAMISQEWEERKL